MTLGEHLWAFTREFAVVLVGAVIVASLIRALVGQMFLIPSSSMENTLLVHDRVVVEKLSTLKRGQVVVFEDPGGWLTGGTIAERGPVGRALEFVGVLPDTATEHLIKRVVGLGGDHVVCCDPQGRITVNDQPLDEASYLYTARDGTRARPSDIRFDVVVPRGRIFVLGDNRDGSRDARCHLNDVLPGTVRGENAFVPEDLVVGRAVAVVWPLDSAKRLRTPETYSSLPEGVPGPQPVVRAGPEASC
jgi:signal peptidase I